LNKKHILFLVPIHNEAKGLPILLESFLSQTYSHFTVLIADNASTDSSRDIVKKYSERDSRIRYVFYDEFVSSPSSFKRAVQVALEKEGFEVVIDLTA
jgi:glycosyltransferase involved in cell wall biosynthesis